MATLEQKYNELKKTLEPNERIFQDVGVPDAYTGEGFYRKPLTDKDGVPRLEKYFVNPKEAATRLHDLAVNGWKEYVPTPAAVKQK